MFPAGRTDSTCMTPDKLPARANLCRVRNFVSLRFAMVERCRGNYQVSDQFCHFQNKQFEIEKKYEQTIRTKYAAKVEALDFSKAKEAAKVIDDFISNTTEGKIHDMVTEGTVQGTFSEMFDHL
ncbi:hypothetical protein OSTOST_25547, partial [Ostertagia ostertagi]